MSLQSTSEVSFGLLIAVSSSGCSHGIQFVQILNLWKLSHFRTKESESVNMVTSQYNADAAVGSFLQVYVIRISSSASFITAGTYLTSWTKDIVCVNSLPEFSAGPLNNFYLEWSIFLRVPCYKMHQKKFYFSGLLFFQNDSSSSDDSFLQLYKKYLKKTTVSSSCVGSSTNFYFINGNGLS
jgi:hypothetical protein